MKLSRILSCGLLIAALFAGVSANAAESRSATPLNPNAAPGVIQPGVIKPGAVQAVPGGMPAAPLKNEIRLGTGMSKRIVQIVAQVKFDKLNQQYTEFSGNAKKFESGAGVISEIAKECAKKAYSVQDQKAAGCTGNDTLNQCMDKLYKHCVKNFSSSGYSLPGGGYNPVTGQKYGGGEIPAFSTAQFLQSAQTTAAQARVLSQQLGQYASQVEQNAKALVP
ncbi:MAG: hypothetical protein NUV55_00030 [Sulfuricaulis sp.]|uniref:hypothetical protein n=1 Tax=Sulfuricaulis sp. TaxID=2003553 RepID=UPI0025E1AC17|nr:hypothetical protein [Sulfuricaulis sp.]MCR4345585.1 hypothetical protein [Sulfuricaulis sp.]